jgi:hypothetical protein
MLAPVGRLSLDHCDVVGLEHRKAVVSSAPIAAIRQEVVRQVQLMWKDAGVIHYLAVAEAVVWGARAAAIAECGRRVTPPALNVPRDQRIGFLDKYNVICVVVELVGAVLLLRREAPGAADVAVDVGEAAALGCALLWRDPTVGTRAGMPSRWLSRHVGTLGRRGPTRAGG